MMKLLTYKKLTFKTSKDELKTVYMKYSLCLFNVKEYWLVITKLRKFWIRNLHASFLPNLKNQGCAHAPKKKFPHAIGIFSSWSHLRPGKMIFNFRFGRCVNIWNIGWSVEFRKLVLKKTFSNTAYCDRFLFHLDFSSTSFWMTCKRWELWWLLRIVSLIQKLKQKLSETLSHHSW